MSLAFLDGAAIGFAVAVPIGPISLLCAQRALREGLRAAVASGAGAATAHAIFFLLARASRGAIGLALAEHHGTIRLASAAVIIAFGVAVIRRQGSSLCIAPLPARLYTSMLLLALTNPMTILPYLAASTVADDIPLFSGASLLGAAGAMVGALSCYSALSGATIACRQALAGAAATHVNLAAGVLLIAFGGSIALGCL
jgi:threonine/homoserine/homoserine lactone efflux protein